MIPSPFLPPGAARRTMASFDGSLPLPPSSFINGLSGPSNPAPNSLTAFGEATSPRGEWSALLQRGGPRPYPSPLAPNVFAVPDETARAAWAAYQALGAGQTLTYQSMNDVVLHNPPCSNIDDISDDRSSDAPPPPKRRCTASGTTPSVRTGDNASLPGDDEDGRPASRSLSSSSRDSSPAANPVPATRDIRQLIADTLAQRSTAAVRQARIRQLLLLHVVAKYRLHANLKPHSIYREVALAAQQLGVRFKPLETAASRTLELQAAMQIRRALAFPHLPATTVGAVIVELARHPTGTPMKTPDILAYLKHKGIPGDRANVTRCQRILRFVIQQGFFGAERAQFA